MNTLMIICLAGSLLVSDRGSEPARKLMVEHYRHVQTLRCANYDFTTLKLRSISDNSAFIGLLQAGRKLAKEDDQRTWVYCTLLRDTILSNPTLSTKLLSRVYASQENALISAANFFIASLGSESRQDLLQKLLSEPRRPEITRLLMRMRHSDFDPRLWSEQA